MMRAIWNDTVLAERDSTKVVEGNHYFPPDDVAWDLLTPNPSVSWCWWKGKASYFGVEADGQVHESGPTTARSS